MKFSQQTVYRISTAFIQTESSVIKGHRRHTANPSQSYTFVANQSLILRINPPASGW